MRALIYARVSSDPRGAGRSVAEQVDECRAFAEREGWTVVDEFTDNDRSASRHARRDRPAWAKTKAALASGEVDVLVTWEASRAQRDLAAYTELREICASHGVRWAYSGTVYDLADRSDRFRTGLDALVAEDEADRTRERVQRALRSNATKGRPHGKRSFGYRRIYDETTGELIGQEPDPIEAPIVQEAARRFLAGESAASIARDFNTRGIAATETRPAWDSSRVKRVLTNPTNAGLRVHRGEIIGAAAWEPLLDEDTYRAVVARYEDPSRRMFRAGPTVHLLSGVARCGVCAGRCRSLPQRTRTGGKRQTYECATNHCVARDAGRLEDLVVRVVLERLNRPDARAALANNQPDPTVVQAAERAAALRTQLDDAVAEFTAGRLTAGTLGRIEADLLPKIADADRAARVAGLPTAAADLALSPDPAGAWSRLEHDQRREVIRSLMTVVVLPLGRGRRTFDPNSVRIEWKA